MTIKEDIKRVIREIPKDVVILAATKSQSIAEIKEAIDAGISIIGENYVQEAEKKYQELKGKAKIHFIGHLQKNKVKKAVEIFDLIVVDSEKIAFEISKYAKKIIPVLIEVNIDKEPNKSGADPSNVIQLLKHISNFNNIKVTGLFTLGPNIESEKLRPFFKQMKLLFEDIKKLRIKNVDMEVLSMGMSDSYKAAIEEGSTEVRLGTIIFGKRK